MASATESKSGVLLSICNSARDNQKRYCCFRQTGSVLWSAPFGNCDSSPTAGDGRVFVSGIDATKQPFGFGGRTVITAVDDASGRLLWVYKTRAPAPFTAVGSSERAITGLYADGMYYQAVPSQDQVLAFNAESGTVGGRSIPLLR